MLIGLFFFYKPYCGACRRVRPFFHALAQTTNTTKLRFGEVDCVKWRPLCNHAGAKTQPQIKLYSSRNLHTIKIKKRFQHDARIDIASWQGLLVAYEIFDWFKQCQHDGLLAQDIAWPADNLLAEYMLKFKQKHDVRHDRATSKKMNYSPRLYLQAVDLAWRMSLHDAIFQRQEDDDKILKNEALQCFRDWLQTLSLALPIKAWRDSVLILQSKLDTHPVLTEAVLTKTLQELNIYEPNSWEIVKPLCSLPQREYPCSLWILFHSLLANSDAHSAPYILHNIHNFVFYFFGCSECAQHFHHMFLEQHGRSVSGSIEANIWLWKAHNHVSQRLFSQPKAFVPWPDNSTCRSCFKSYHHSEKENIAHDKSQTSLLWDRDEYEESYVFQFLSETYCFDSDTFVCAAFDDPSRSKKFRHTHRT
mmetsp:Transcript_6421/g.8236  ORF Transcript_6421/g.8236 Transcript_6421/m.8236 type:complete len:419 (-) Transcript_6421:164-1420(-)